MSEIKDVYDNIYEQVTADNQKQLSALHEKVKNHVSKSASGAVDVIGNTLLGEKASEGIKITAQELVAALFASRIAKDIIVDELTPDTQWDRNQKVGLWNTIKDKVTDAFTDKVLKQEKSYDSVLTAMKEPVIKQFAAEFDQLKKSIAVPVSASTPAEQPAGKEKSKSTNEWYAENSHYTTDEQKQIDEVIESAKVYAWVGYTYGGNDKNGIDCSGLRSKAFGEEYAESNQKFGRLTAAIFDSKAPDVARGDVEKGDWMFWEDPKWVKQGGINEKGMKIYHIEMAMGKPFEKDGKRYVKTYGSSSEKHVLDENGKDTGKWGVGYRLREIKDNHHFAKPPYYEKLVAMEGGSDKKLEQAA